MDNFIHTHLHTEFSNYGMNDAISSIDDVINRVHSLGQKGFAITDHNGCSGLIEGYVKVQKFNKKHNADLKLLMGSELYYTYDVAIKDKSYFHILFIAKDNDGLENLYKLISEAHEHYYYKSRCDLDMIRKYSKGLICTSACMGGWLKSDDRENLLLEFKEIFGDDLYIEIHTYQHEEQYAFNKEIIELANKHNVKLIACCDAHYPTQDKYQLHKYFRGIKESDEDNYYQSNDFYIQSEDEVRDRLSYLDSTVVDKAIANTMEIFNKCNTSIEFNQHLYPKFTDGQNTKEVFLDELRKGYKDKGIHLLPKEQKDIVDKRILHEIDVLEKVDYMDYLLITKDILDNCRKRGIPVGHGRGSVGGCQCAYLLGITTLDAITNGLHFERFANPKRISPADVDNDVSQRMRGEVIDYIKEKYGYVYQCRTFNYLKSRGALHRAGKALGFEDSIVKKWSKKLDKFKVDDEEEDYTNKELEIMMLESLHGDIPDNVIDLAKQFVGIMSGFGKHASCVIISNQDIRKFCSLERQKDSKTNKDVLIASTNFKYLEQIGLLKEDILGLKTLDVVDDVLKSIDNQLDVTTLPWSDKKTINLLQQGDTLGVFQLNKDGMIRTLKRVRPTSLVDLITIVALYRPACIITGILDEYIERRNGKQFEYIDPRLKDVLSRTYGLMVYQEDVMSVVRVIGGYDMAEADTVRRAVGKKDMELMESITKDFVSRAVENGTDESVAKQILDDIVASATYSFNLAHSQSYAYLSYVTAYLKAHYPLEFYVASINSEHGTQEKIIPFIQEIQNKGIEILPPDLRYSSEEWTVENGKIRMGLNYVKGIGSITKPTEYTVDCIYRTYNRRILQSLVKSGALDFLDNREHLFYIIDSYKEKVNNEVKCHERINHFTNIVADLKTIEPANDKEKQSIAKKILSAGKKINEWTLKLHNEMESADKKEPFNKRDFELEVLGITLDNPLSIYDTSLVNGKNVLAVIIHKFDIRKDKNGNDMAFVVAHNGAKYVMFSSSFTPLEVNKGYYIAVNDSNIIQKTKPLELKTVGN